MTANTDLMIFTDLDGTLIDHDTYEWHAAQPALTALGRLNAGIVMASSKTTAEISTLRAKIGLAQWPAIVENGSGILPPYVNEVSKGSQYQSLRSILQNMPEELRSLFCGFGDVSAEGVADMTGLALDDAQLAQQRDFSEPGLWHGTDEQKSTFLRLLEGQGITAQQGGRFLTLSFGGNKVDQMRKLIETYQPKHTIALGDAPNDVKMLENADFGVVVANPHRAPLPPLSGEAQGRIYRTKAAGPLGWNEAILDLLNRIELH